MHEVSLSTAINPHFFLRLAALAERRGVYLTEDVYDQRGLKVGARGARLGTDLRVRLMATTLRRPLETALGVEDGIDAGAIGACAQELIDACAPLRRIVGATSGHGTAPLALLGRAEFAAGTGLLFTLAAEGGALSHCVMVSLLAVCMAKRLHLSAADQQSAALAGLLHDIGELYLDPAWLAPGRPLLAHEWAQMAAHPRHGQKLVNELDCFPLAVGRAVAEHHERFNGTGYPRQIGGHQISGPGQAVAVAEMIAGVLTRDWPLERAELALKIIPGEHAHDLVSAVSGALRAQPRSVAALADAGIDVARLYWRLASALETGHNLASTPGRAPADAALLARTLERLRVIQRAFISTGLDSWLDGAHGLHEAGPAVQFEKAVASREIAWRLRDLARDLALHAGTRTLCAGLIELLDGDVGGVPEPAPAAAMQAHAPARASAATSP